MIHGLISLLYNGLLLGAAGAPLQRMAAWLAPTLPGQPLLPPLPKIRKPLLPQEARRERAHAHVKGNDLIQYCSG